jgi:flagellar basal body-associated protein FliL
MSRFFVLCLVGIAAVLATSGVRYYRLRSLQRQIQAEKKEMNENLQKQAEALKQKNITADLGRFNIDLAEPGPGQKKVSMDFHVAEIDLVAACDSKETCQFIENHLAAARDQVVQLVAAVERDDLMSRDGKAQLRKAIQDKLNSWVPQGKVVDVFISRLIMG